MGSNGGDTTTHSFSDAHLHAGTFGYAETWNMLYQFNQGGNEMRMKRKKLFTGLVVSLSAVILGCATTRNGDIEKKLISEFCEKGKTVLYEVEGHRESFKIDPTFKESENGCPIAVIRAWRDGRLTEEKEVELCNERCRR